MSSATTTNQIVETTRLSSAPASPEQFSADERDIAVAGGGWHRHQWRWLPMSMVGPAHRAAEDYANCNDFTLWVMPSSGHHPFVAHCAPELYRRILHWLDGLWLNSPKAELAAGEFPPGSYETALWLSRG
jgi:hypothetical protein